MKRAARRSQAASASADGRSTDTAAPAPATPAPPATASNHLIYSFYYLCTGTWLNVLAQLVTNQGATHPSAQLIAWTKYMCNFLFSLAAQAPDINRQRQRPSPSLKVRVLRNAVG